MSKLPDFEGLAYFARVVEERSFAAAAWSLGVSVSTVSRGVSELEGRLGAQLLNRTSRQLALTELRKIVAESAIQLSRDAEATENLVRESAVQPRGRVRLAVPMSFGLRWVAPLLPHLQCTFEETRASSKVTHGRSVCPGKRLSEWALGRRVKPRFVSCTLSATIFHASVNLDDASIPS